MIVADLNRQPAGKSNRGKRRAMRELRVLADVRRTEERRVIRAPYAETDARFHALIAKSAAHDAASLAALERVQEGDGK